MSPTWGNNFLLSKRARFCTVKKRRVILTHVPEPINKGLFFYSSEVVRWKARSIYSCWWCLFSSQVLLVKMWTCVRVAREVVKECAKFTLHLIVLPFINFVMAKHWVMSSLVEITTNGQVIIYLVCSKSAALFAHSTT